MNWKIIFQLSIFGLIMAFGTVSLIPEKTEFVFWIVIFVFCAWVIAKVCDTKYFAHGFFVGLYNCVWITAVHLIYFQKYMINHPSMDNTVGDMPAALLRHPRVSTAILGLGFGVIAAVVLGLFSLVASKIVKDK